MSLFEQRLADLPLSIDDYALERLQRDVSSQFTRVSTVIRLRGGGEEGQEHQPAVRAGQSAARGADQRIRHQQPRPHHRPHEDDCQHEAEQRRRHEAHRGGGPREHAEAP